MLLLARKWILPFARDAGAGGLGVSSKVDGLFERTTMDLVRCYDSQLKKLFAWCVLGTGLEGGMAAGSWSMGRVGLWGLDCGSDGGLTRAPAPRAGTSVSETPWRFTRFLTFHADPGLAYYRL